MSEKVIIGIGNPLKKDDGIGVHVIRSLGGMVPDDVELVEGSVYCADMLPFLENRKKAIFIDGIDAGAEPGAVFRFSPEDVRQDRKSEPLSVHDFGLYDLITAADLLGQLPEEITLIAVQVKSVELGEELSEELVQAIPKVTQLIIEELERK